MSTRVAETVGDPQAFIEDLDLIRVVDGPTVH